MKTNPFVPDLATVVEVVQETENIKTLRVVLNDKQRMEEFNFTAGQVAQLSLFGVGESTFVINSPPSNKAYLQFSIMRVGEVTSKLHQLAPGDQLGVRGPLGRGFPFEELQGKNLLFIGGGIGMAPLRTLLLSALESAEHFGQIQVIYGARTPRDLCFHYEFEMWRDRGAELILTVDQEYPGWKGRVGFVPAVLAEEAPSPNNCVAITCGPPIMIKFVLQGLKELEFGPEQILTTLEKRMKCGIGLCGRCNIGNKYVCVDGPVFSLAELQRLPDEL